MAASPALPVQSTEVAQAGQQVRSEYDDGAFWPAASLPSALSTAQIDQILDALEERLALMLLRMYGS
jgi:hypothetical protein